MTIRYSEDQVEAGKIGTARISKPLVVAKKAVAPAGRADGMGNGPSRSTEPAAAAPAEKKRSELEVRLEQQILAAGLPKPETEWYCIPGRDWRLDFAWPLMKPPRYVEVNGAAHRIKSRFHADLAKRAHLFFEGWIGIEVGSDHVKDQVTAITWVKQLLEL